MQAPRSSGQTMANSEGTNGRWKDYGVPSRIPDTSYGLEKGSNGTSRDCRIVDWSCVFPLKTDANTTSRERGITNKIAERHPGWRSTVTASRTYASVQLQTRPVSHPRYKEKAVVVSGTASVTATRNPADISVKEVCEIPVFGRTLELIVDTVRLASNGLSNPQSTRGGNAPILSSEPHNRQSSVNTSSRYSFSRPGVAKKQETLQSSGSFDFLPSVNFDDLHSSIGSGEPDIHSFPAPGGASQAFSGISAGPTSTTYRPVTSGSLKSVDPSDFGFPKALNSSSLRRQNSSTHQKGPAVTAANNIVHPNGPAAARARRKTYFPAASSDVHASAPIMRAPRKSVGPGILTVDTEGVSHPQRRPTLAQAGFGEAANASDLGTSTSRRNVSDTLNGDRESTNRHNKTKSLQPPPRKILAPQQFYTPAGTPEQNSASPIGASRSPGRPERTHMTITPSSNKRLSVMPGSAHATGLGARTISPTDARRLKRMSMMPNPPPVPFTPPTPQPDPPFATERPTAPSPSMIPRKSVTPSSSRTTPDPNRKSYSSGVSNSSTTSYNSCLASSGSLRMSQTLSTSRLPTPKTKGDNAPTGDDEVVPPVPAIPKAYESPKGDFEHPPFFSTRKSSVSHDTSSLSSTLASGEVPSPIDLEPPKNDRQLRPHKVSNVETEPATEKKPNLGANAANRRTLQPLRLPPLNLLPLSTPTTSKIAALHETSASKNGGAVTPPPKNGAKVTPTTPMTASKASFSRNYYEDDNAPLPAGIRSSSSHYNMRAEALSYRAASSSSTVAPVPSDPYAVTASRTAMSPFVSSSLPKSSLDFGYARLEKSNTFDIGAEAKPARLTGPRLQKPRKTSKDDASSMETTNSIDTSVHSIGNSIRRKLSLTRKRSHSKAQSTADKEAEALHKSAQHDDMPPPKLPASATWNGPLLASPSPSQQLGQSRASRVASNSSVNVRQDRNRSSTFDASVASRRETRPAENVPNLGPKRTARAALEGAPVSNALSLKDFLREAKTMELTLDRDDLSAEDEMKKLASKRKETEIAAKEVDALRRRATAKERVGPSSALRMAQLNIFERGEIVDYKDVYFCGTKDAKKHAGDLSTGVANFGYDDDRGDYNIVTGDHLSYRYEIVDVLGKGSFGQVVRCIDHKTGVLVAIKIIRNKKRFHQQALVEVEILQKLREWVNLHRLDFFALHVLTDQLGPQ